MEAGSGAVMAGVTGAHEALPADLRFEKETANVAPDPGVLASAQALNARRAALPPDASLAQQMEAIRQSTGKTVDNPEGTDAAQEAQTAQEEMTGNAPPAAPAGPPARGTPFEVNPLLANVLGSRDAKDALNRVLTARSVDEAIQAADELARKGPPTKINTPAPPDNSEPARQKKLGEAVDQHAEINAGELEAAQAAQESRAADEQKAQDLIRQAEEAEAADNPTKATQLREQAAQLRQPVDIARAPDENPANGQESNTADAGTGPDGTDGSVRDNAPAAAGPRAGEEGSPATPAAPAGITRADGYTTAPANQPLVSRLSSRLFGQLKQGVTAGKLTAIEVPPNRKDVQTAALMAERLFGKKLVLFKTDGGPRRINGAVMTDDGHHIYLDVEANRPVLAIVGHEMLHMLRKESPFLYTTLIKNTRGAITGKTVFENWYRSKTSISGMSSDDIHEELMANIAGEQWVDPEFVRQFALNHPGIFQRVATRIISFLNSAWGRAQRITGYEGEKYIADVQKVRDAYVKAFSDYAHQQKLTGKIPAETESESGAVKASLKDEDEDEDPNRPYANAPNSLMGYRKNAPNTPFAESNYKNLQYVKVTWPDGDSIYDAMRGLNEPHTMERARRNWPTGDVQKVSRAEALQADPDLVRETEEQMGIARPETLDANGDRVPDPDEYNGKKVSVPIHIEDTGETAHLDMDARKTLDDYQDRMGVMRQLVECLGR